MAKRTTTAKDSAEVLRVFRTQPMFFDLAFKLDPEGAAPIFERHLYYCIINYGGIGPTYRQNLPRLTNTVVEHRLRRLYPYLLASFADNVYNSVCVATGLDKLPDAEWTTELQETFRKALAYRIEIAAVNSSREHDQLNQLAPVALKHGVSSAIPAILEANDISPHDVVEMLRPWVNLPQDEAEALRVMKATSKNWVWNSAERKYYNSDDVKAKTP